jgi:hypothetical protein
MGQTCLPLLNKSYIGILQFIELRSPISAHGPDQSMYIIISNLIEPNKHVHYIYHAINCSYSLTHRKNK